MSKPVNDQAIGIRVMIARLERMNPDGTSHPVIPAEAVEAVIPWEELRPYEQQQGGYWAYPKNAGLYGEGKVFIRVARPTP